MGSKIIKDLEESTGQELHGIGLVKDFLIMTPNAQTTKGKHTNLTSCHICIKRHYQQHIKEAQVIEENVYKS